MKKIILISHSQKLGGAEKCLIRIAQQLKSYYDVSVILPAEGENYLEFTAIGINVEIAKYPWWVHKGKQSPLMLIRKTGSLFLSIIRFYILIKNKKPAFVLTNTATIPSGAIASWILGIKHYWFLHEVLQEDHDLIFDFGWKFSTNVILKCSKIIIANSKFVANKYASYMGISKLKVINLNVPLPIFSFVAESKLDLTLYIIGQIQPGKGQLIGLKALLCLNKVGFKCNLVIKGAKTDIQYYNSLLSFIKTHNLVNVVFEDHSDSPFKNMNAHSFGLMCSHSEAFGMVTIEFMKIGIPVIGLKAGETQNIITHKVNGMLFEQDGGEDLANNILELYNSPGLKEDIIKNASSYANSNFNADLFLKQLLTIVGYNE